MKSAMLEAAHWPNPARTIRSAHAVQLGNPELHLILELTSGKVSEAAAENKAVIRAGPRICQPGRG